MHLPDWLNANRIALGATWLTGLGATVCGLAQVFPSGSQWANYALVGGGLITKVATSITFAAGSQKWDALTIGRPNIGASPDDAALLEGEIADDEYNGPIVEPPEGEYNAETAGGKSTPVETTTPPSE